MYHPGRVTDRQHVDENGRKRVRQKRDDTAKAAHPKVAEMVFCTAGNPA